MKKRGDFPSLAATLNLASSQSQRATIVVNTPLAPAYQRQKQIPKGESKDICQRGKIGRPHV